VLGDDTTLPWALLRPDAYPHAPQSGALRQTHVSWVFLADDRVYKVKRPVKFPFVDYSTLERRKKFCEEEVRLNRRTAPDTYLGVVAIVRRADGSLGIGGDADGAEIVEYAVEMRRLPDAGMLDHKLRDGTATKNEVMGLADALVAFHRGCATGPGVDEFGTPAVVEAAFLKTVAGARAHLDPVFADRIETHFATALDPADLQKRVDDGRIRDGHGDLHAGNICFMPAGDAIFYDCIEFDPALRCGDVAADVAFLAMDLDRYGRSEWSRALLEKYARATGDAEFVRLAGIYAIRRALVRASVSRILADETGEPAAVDAAREYSELAAAYTLPPVVIAMCGAPASGKSRIAKSIARPLRAEVVRSDVERKRLCGMEPTERWRGAVDAGPYRAELTQQTYEELIRRAREESNAERSVVLDATYSDPEQRTRLLSACANTTVLFVWVDTPAEERRTRSATRERDPEAVSDARAEIFEQLTADFHPPVELTATQCLKVDGTAPPAEAVHALLLKLATR